MAILILILSLLIFSILFYGSLPKEISIFRKFDFLFRTLFIFFLIGRLYGLFGSGFDIALEWGLAPVTLLSDDVSIFAKLPWIILRFWDGNWGYPGYLLSIYASIVISFFLGFKDLKYGSKILEGLIIPVFVQYTIVLSLQSLFGLELFEGEVGMFAIELSLSQALLNLLLLLFGTILFVVFRVRYVGIITLFLYGGINLILLIIQQYFEFDFLYLNIAPIQAGIFIVVGVWLFVLAISNKILSTVDIEGFDLPTSRNGRFGRDSDRLINLYRGKYIPRNK
jgi:hypothetical protein